MLIIFFFLQNYTLVLHQKITRLSQGISMIDIGVFLIHESLVSRYNIGILIAVKLQLGT